VIPPVVVHCGFGGLLAALSVPLVLRMVPMKRFYGIRIPKAFVSDSNWYEINAYGGRILLAYGVALVGFGVLARHSAPPPTSIWTAVFIVGPMVLVFPLLGLIIARARRLP
jgi:hypothetical protein